MLHTFERFVRSIRCKSIPLLTRGRTLSISTISLPSFNLYSFLKNRRSLGNAPIRKARFRQIFHVIDSISNLASELEWAVCDVILNGNTLGRITRMLTNNSLRGCGGSGVVPKPPTGGESSRVGTNILSRSLMLINLYFDEKLLGQYDFTDLIGEVIEVLITNGLPSKHHRRCPGSLFLSRILEQKVPD